MKKIIPAILFLFISFSAIAQCSFDPTISGETILCPGQSTELSTQEYDSYQWYRREFSGGSLVPISGATDQTITLFNPADVLYYYAVEATLDTCTELSPEVLLDAWAFIPVVVSSNGTFTVGNNGETIVCYGDTFYYELLLPYNTNITWYHDGTPIPGENSSQLIVTDPGVYSVSGAPSECPDYIQTIGVSLVVEFIECVSDIDDPDAENETVLLYPNPASTFIHLEAKAEKIKSISTYNCLGQFMYRENVDAFEKNVGIQHLDAGIYFLVINTKYKQFTKKVVVKR